MKGKLRCYAHGGGSTGPASPEGKARSLAARVEGRRRWVEQMRQAKAAGLAARFPGGRPPAGRYTAPPGTDRVVARARRVIEQEQQAMRKKIAPDPAALPATVPRPEPSHGDRLHDLTGKALTVINDVLDAPCAPDNYKLMSLKKDAALSILGAQIKVDVGKVRQDNVGHLLQLLDDIRHGRPATFLDDAPGAGT
jgi:hypothetical protein